jgi:hypothetical protein
MTTETKVNMVFAVLFAIMTVTALVGAGLFGAWWHLYTFVTCAGLTYAMLTARDSGGDSAWKRIKEGFKFLIDN